MVAAEMSNMGTEHYIWRKVSTVPAAV